VYTLAGACFCGLFAPELAIPALVYRQGWHLPNPRYRVLVIASHPVQYVSPLLRRMAIHPDLDLTVAYCTLRGIEPTLDPEFGVTVQWDVPLLDGYSWVEVPNLGGDAFWGLSNPGLWKLIRTGKFDAIICYLSYWSPSFWISFFACRFSGSAFLYGTDASSLVPRGGSSWRLKLKKIIWPRLYSLPDQLFVPSVVGRQMMVSLGISADRVTLTPSSVDNDWWKARAQLVDREAVRAKWGAAKDTSVILFCAKLQPWKRPMDLLKAFARAGVSNALLVYAGDGAQRRELETEAVQLGVSDRVRFLGFVNQSQLPPVYASADLMVLPSEYEPFGLVVNEAACCGCAVAVSDRVGAAQDLVAPVDPRLVYPCGDIDALASVLRELSSRKEELRVLGERAKARMETWTTAEAAAAYIEAIHSAVQHRVRK
jgi:glycosyltransferase involved in cell wall biosynthesis